MLSVGDPVEVKRIRWSNGKQFTRWEAAVVTEATERTIYVLTHDDNRMAFMRHSLRIRPATACRT